MMNNYAWTLIIWWKRKIFIYFINCYWIKNLLSIVIQSKNILLCFISTKLTACMSSTWSAVLYLVCLFFSFLMQNWVLRYTCKYFFQHVLNFFSIVCIFKSFKNVVMCFVFSYKKLYNHLLKSLLKRHWKSLSVDRVLQLHIFFNG